MREAPRRLPVRGSVCDSPNQCNAGLLDCVLPTPRTERLQTAACASGLFALNAYIVRELFTVEYTRFMGSIEGAHVSVARQLAESWDTAWWPLWYGGIPFPNTYPPLFHWITALLSIIAHISAAVSDHAVSAFFYCAGPVTLFWLAYRLSARIWPSFVGALLYSLVSPAAFLITSVRHDVGGVFHPRRLQAVLMYGEGPHVSSMTLLPVAIVLLDIALQRRRPLFYVLAAFGMASVALTNWLGASALAAAVAAYILSRGRKELKTASLQCLGIAILAYAVAARWLPPSTVASIRTNEQLTAAPYEMTRAHYFLCLAVLVAVLILAWLWLNKRNAPPHLRFFLIFGFFMSAITLSFVWWRILLMPQPDRYHLEMEMALAPLAAFALALPAGCLSAGSSRSRHFGLRPVLLPARQAESPLCARSRETARCPHHQRIQGRRMDGSQHERPPRFRFRLRILLAKCVHQHAAAIRRF